MGRWSLIGRMFDMFAWTSCMATVAYCVFWTLRGAYADIPFVSESVYIQVILVAAARTVMRCCEQGWGGSLAGSPLVSQSVHIQAGMGS